MTVKKRKNMLDFPIKEIDLYVGIVECQLVRPWGSPYADILDLWVK